MSTTDNILLTVGQSFKYQLSNSTPRWVIVTNKSPYDVKISGFGVIGESWVVAGTADKFYNNNETGYINLVAVNTTNVFPQNQGAILITQYLPGDDEPKGTFPVSIPFQSVQASGVTSLGYVALGASPYKFFSGTLSGTQTFNLNGSNGIPANASALYINAYGTSSNVGDYLNGYPFAASPPADPSDSTLIFMVQVSGHNNVGNGIVSLDNMGNFTMKGNGTLTGLAMGVVGYFI